MAAQDPCPQLRFPFPQLVCASGGGDEVIELIPLPVNEVIELIPFPSLLKLGRSVKLDHGHSPYQTMIFEKLMKNGHIAG